MIFCKVKSEPTKCLKPICKPVNLFTRSKCWRTRLQILKKGPPGKRTPLIAANSKQSNRRNVAQILNERVPSRPAFLDECPSGICLSAGSMFSGPLSDIANMHQGRTAAGKAKLQFAKMQLTIYLIFRKYYRLFMTEEKPSCFFTSSLIEFFHLEKFVVVLASSKEIINLLCLSCGMWLLFGSSLFVFFFVLKIYVAIFVFFREVTNFLCLF